ncbi:MAG: YXWGXW repeat-containing protein [Burkholderiales bacterium]|nr:YXWGXW repeat-containing protein [Burkholderiales bacterium]
MSNFDNQGSKTMRRTVQLAVASALGLAMLGGCATHERVIVKETVVERPAPVVIRHMPSQIHEDRGQRPGDGWNWVPGHWKWEGNDWFWVHGKWVAQPVQPMPALIVEQITVAPSPQHYWVPGHWVWQFEGNGGWFWVKGSWRR